MRLRFTHAVLALAVVATVSGCRQSPEKARDSFIATGDAHMTAKKYAEASTAYRMAATADPKSALAFSKLGEAFIASDNIGDALRVFVRASDLGPGDLALQVRTGNLLLAAGRFEDVKNRARNILVKDPQNVSGLVLLGNALAGLNNLDEAVDVAAKAASLEPKRAGLLANVGVLELARGNTEEAERLFLRASERDPKAISPLLALSNLYQTIGRSKDAEVALRKAVSLDTKSAAANSALGALLVQTGRANEAEPYIRTAVDTAGTLKASLGLADYLVAVGRSGEGLAMLEKLASTKEGFAASRMRKAIIDHASGRREEAHATLQEILKREPRNIPVMALQSRLLLGENRVDEAEAAVKAAIAIDFRQPQAHVALGRILRVKGDVEQARKSFMEAAKQDPNRIDAQIELSRLHLSRREIDTAIGYAEAAVRLSPDSLDTWLQLVRTLTVRTDDLPKAEGHLRTLTARYPNSPDLVSMAAIVALQDDERGRARTLFVRALQMDPDHLEALNGLTTLDAENGRLADARARVENRLAASKNPGPGLLMLAVKISVASGDSKQVESGLKRLIAAAPTSLDNYHLLGQFYASQRRLPEAKREFEALVKRNPRRATAQTMLGLIRQAGGDRAGAREAFQAAVRAEPKSAAASNNLAWMYATEGVNLDEALMLAQAARAQFPGSPMTADTLAFVYYKKGMGTMSTPLLEQAIEAQPKNPIYHYHLGLVHAQAGEDAKARKALQLALELNPKFDGADDARGVISSLVY